MNDKAALKGTEQTFSASDQLISSTDTQKGNYSDIIKR